MGMPSDRRPADSPRPVPPEPGSTTTRRRGAALTRAIFLATLEELAETSFEELSFEKVAARAGTGKAALYRRWSCPAELVLAALSDPATGFPAADAPETGSLREDLLIVLGAFARALEEPRGRALRPLIAQRPRHPELFDEVFRTLIVPHQRLLLGMLRSAADRGEARPDAVTGRIASVGPRLIVAESMQTGSVPPSEVEAVVEEILLPLTTTRTR